MASCSAVAGTATRAPVPTNGAGLARVFVQPCEQIPHLVLRQQLLDPSPAVVSKHTTASGTETRACTYRSTDRSQHITIIASNNMLDQGQTSLLGTDRHALTIGGRRAVSFVLPNSVQTHACEVDLAATTGYLRCTTKHHDHRLRSLSRLRGGRRALCPGIHALLSVVEPVITAGA